MPVRIGARLKLAGGPDPLTLLASQAIAPMDFDEFTLTGNLRVDDGISDAVKDMQLNNACAVATKFQSIAGVLSYSFNNSKLMPRVKADIVLGPDNNCNPWP